MDENRIDGEDPTTESFTSAPQEDTEPEFDGGVARRPPASSDPFCIFTSRRWCRHACVSAFGTAPEPSEGEFGETRKPEQCANCNR